MTKATLVGLYRLLRFELSFTAGVCVVLGEIFALGGLPSLEQGLLGFLSFFCIAATALILNDCIDLETDRINAAHRPLPSGMVSRTGALWFSVVVAMVGFAASHRIGLDAFALVVAVWVVGVLYNWRLKKSGLLGNVMVAFSVGTTFVFGGLVVGNPGEAIVWYLAVTTMLVDLGEEIAADALDVEGDRATGSRSLAVRFGPERAMRIAAGVFGVVVAGSLLPFWMGWLEWYFFPPLLGLDAIIVYSSARLLDPRREGRMRDIRRIYLGGLAAFLVILGIRVATA